MQKPLPLAAAFHSHKRQLFSALSPQAVATSVCTTALRLSSWSGIVQPRCLSRNTYQGRHIYFSYFSGCLLTGPNAAAWSFGENDKRLQLLLVPLPHSEGTALGLQGPHAQRRCWTLFGRKQTQAMWNKNANKPQFWNWGCKSIQ